MGNIVEYMPSELANEGDYMFMDWVDKYTIEMEDQVCTRLACISRGLFEMHALEEKPHELPL